MNRQDAKYAKVIRSIGLEEERKAVGLMSDAVMESGF
jgi:Arc/MetJ family transcription regulator